MGFEDKAREHLGDPESFDETAAEQAFGGPDLDLPLKPGEYEFEVEKCEDKQTKKGGEMRSMWLKVTDNNPKYSGRIIFPNFVFDCGNEDVEKQAVEQIKAIWTASGEESTTAAGDMEGLVFRARTGLEFNDYKDGEYQPVLWGVVCNPDGPPPGPYPDEDQPDVWAEAIEHAKDQAGVSDSSGSSGNSESFDDDDIPF